MAAKSSHEIVVRMRPQPSSILTMKHHSVALMGDPLIAINCLLIGFTISGIILKCSFTTSKKFLNLKICESNENMEPKLFLQVAELPPTSYLSFLKLNCFILWKKLIDCIFARMSLGNRCHLRKAFSKGKR